MTMPKGVVTNRLSVWMALYMKTGLTDLGVTAVLH
jgi:hypothetical protein